MNDAQKKQVPLRLSPRLYDAIAAWAEDDFRSVNGQIEYLLRPANARCATGLSKLTVPFASLKPG